MNRKKNKTFEIPKEWLKEKSKHFEVGELTVKKRLLGWLRTAGRVVAVLLIPINAIFAYIFYGPPNPTDQLQTVKDVMALFFSLNIFILIDYLFKTKPKKRTRLETS